VALARTHSVSLVGVQGHAVEIEADIENGLDCMANQETQGVYSKPFTTPDNLDAGALIRKDTRYIGRCIQRNDDLQFLSTANTYVARDVWSRSDIQARDVRCAQLYDAFTPLILVSGNVSEECARQRRDGSDHLRVIGKETGDEHRNGSNQPCPCSKPIDTVNQIESVRATHQPEDREWHSQVPGYCKASQVDELNAVHTGKSRSCDLAGKFLLWPQSGEVV